MQGIAAHLVDQFRPLRVRVDGLRAALGAGQRKRGVGHHFEREKRARAALARATIPWNCEPVHSFSTLRLLPNQPLQQGLVTHQHVSHKLPWRVRLR